MKHFRNELYFPEILNNKNYDSWLADGGITFGEIANKKVKMMLDEHRGSELPPVILQQIRRQVDGLTGEATTK